MAKKKKKKTPANKKRIKLRGRTTGSATADNFWNGGMPTRRKK